jgi:hypothetical protein
MAEGPTGFQKTAINGASNGGRRDPEYTANAKVATYAAKLGFAPLDAGLLLCSRYFEAMAHLNVQLAIGMGGGTNAAFLYDQSGR